MTPRVLVRVEKSSYVINRALSFNQKICSTTVDTISFTFCKTFHLLVLRASWRRLFLTSSHFFFDIIFLMILRDSCQKWPCAFKKKNCLSSSDAAKQTVKGHGQYSTGPIKVVETSIKSQKSTWHQAQTGQVSVEQLQACRKGKACWTTLVHAE